MCRVCVCAWWTVLRATDQVGVWNTQANETKRVKKIKKKKNSFGLKGLSSLVERRKMTNIRLWISEWSERHKRSNKIESIGNHRGNCHIFGLIVAEQFGNIWWRFNSQNYLFDLNRRNWILNAMWCLHSYNVTNTNNGILCGLAFSSDSNSVLSTNEHVCVTTHIHRKTFLKCDYTHHQSVEWMYSFVK